MQFYDRYLSNKAADSIEKILLKDFNTFWKLDRTLYPDEYGEGLNSRRYFDCPQMVHDFVRYGEIKSEFTQSILRNMNWPVLCQNLGIPNNVWRMKSNLMFKNKTSKSNTPHIDSNKKHIAMIYYVNDSDGETTIYNKVRGDDLRRMRPIKKFKPRKGSFLVFDGEKYHSSRPPQNHDLRCVINFDLLDPEWCTQSVPL